MTDSPLRTPDWVHNNGHRPTTGQQGQPCPHCARIGAIAAATQDALRDIGITLQVLHDLATAIRDERHLHNTHTRALAAKWLTDRETEVLQRLAAGKSNLAIARDLHLSEETVKCHARTLYRKLGVKERAQAVAAGYDLGLLQYGASRTYEDLYNTGGSR